MYNFFADSASRRDGSFFLTGPDCNHMIHVLRMRQGDLFLVSSGGVSSLCRLAAAEDGVVRAEIVEENHQTTELPVGIRLFQGLPKGDKLEVIIQKTVELGVSAVIPVEMSRCVVRLTRRKSVPVRPGGSPLLRALPSRASGASSRRWSRLCVGGRRWNS